MSAARLLASLHDTGIEVRAISGGTLRLMGAVSRISPALLAEVRARKAELLAFVGDEQPATLPPTLIDLEIQAAERALGGFTRFATHATACCFVHGIQQRRVPGRGGYRCPVCVSAAFNQRRAI
jgi:hypothetical protein